MATGNNVRKMWLKKVIDALSLVIYYRLNTGKEVIEKYMSSYHSEVAES
jgi:hypothetical protein